MMIKTIRLRKTGIVLLVLVIAAVVRAGVLAAVSIGSAGRDGTQISTEAQRQAFLKRMGWSTGEKFLEKKTVTIPETFTEVYINYNKLQKQQGFDLTKHKGEKAVIYTYQVKNYPDRKNDDSIVCHLMSVDGQLIGGDVCSTSPEGFMQGLRR
ncbi:MAG: DUF4830 domain-containing protein [Ruminococcus sp.]|nr:DUF4830 domain-containing protein [Ruminococcus sp.]